MHVEGSVALVTGANRGLGQAFARSLIDKGASRVYAAARRPEEITDNDVTPVRLDITSAEQVADASRRCTDVNLLINNAVEVIQSPLIAAGSLEPARAQMETNYFGTLAMCQAFAPVLARNGGGAIVNMCSIVSFFNVPSMGSFCPTKAALWSMTHGIRIELRSQGTQVVSVHVGFIDTRQSAGFDVPKHAPADIAAKVIQAVEGGSEEVLADERTRQVKANVPRDLELIYPEVARQWHSSLAGAPVSD
jgi:NAD(P)-dependent dehydrogenase (short-subunit alcohol dehydrogenase family)